MVEDVISYLMPKGVEHGRWELGFKKLHSDFISDAERR